MVSGESSIEKLKRRLKEEEEKLKLIKQKQKELRSRLSKEKRKKETRMKIQIGAIFMKYFDIQSLEEAESVARQFAEYVREKKHYQREESQTDDE